MIFNSSQKTPWSTVSPWSVRESAIFSLERGQTSYTSSYGFIRLRRAIAEYLENRWKAPYHPEKEITVTVGVSQAIDLLMRVLLDPEDEVIIPAPYWTSYPEMVRLVGGVPTRSGPFAGPAGGLGVGDLHPVVVGGEGRGFLDVTLAVDEQASPVPVRHRDDHGASLLEGAHVGRHPEASLPHHQIGHRHRNGVRVDRVLGSREPDPAALRHEVAEGSQLAEQPLTGRIEGLELGPVARFDLPSTLGHRLLETGFPDPALRRVVLVAVDVDAEHAVVVSLPVEFGETVVGEHCRASELEWTDSSFFPDPPCLVPSTAGGAAKRRAVNRVPKGTRIPWRHLQERPS